jgi:hypothetical protein
MSRRPAASRHIILAAVVAVPFLLSCSLVNAAVNSAVNSAVGGSGTTVANLWPDVPPFPGATKANLEIPAAVRVVIAGLVKAVSAEGQSKNEGRLDSFEFIGYTSTSTTDEITAFYTPERMAQEGWTEGDQSGCATTTGTEVNVGTFCSFARKDGQESTVLFIVVVPGQASQVDIFYMRFAGVVYSNN